MPGCIADGEVSLPFSFKGFLHFAPFLQNETTAPNLYYRSGRSEVLFYVCILKALFFQSPI